MTDIFQDEWFGLYKESWKGHICDDAFRHPAKFSRALIRRIYDHVIEEGWANKGDSVVDPFGGVALGAHDAMRHGLNWYGCELESRFVALGAQNIALWSERFSRMPNWGTARLLQGDSRMLGQVLKEAHCCVSSPPYVAPPGHGGGDWTINDSKGLYPLAYGDSEGQLGAMKEGDLNLAISSPPYAGSLANAKNYADPGKAKADSEREFMQHRSSTYADLRYGETEGNLGAMPEGRLCVTSPPFEQSLSLDRPNAAARRELARERGITNAEHISPIEMEKIGKRHEGDYGATEGNLGNMRGGFEAAVSSPPYEGNTKSDYLMSEDNKTRARDERRGFKQGAGCFRGSEGAYGQSEGQLGIERGETFWSASRLILEQLHQVIIPGGHAVFVVKAFVRDKKIVDFPGQWAQLCEAVGFRLLHDHHALLTENYGTQGGFEGDKEMVIARKSFFRRLAESKGSPKIDYENVLCFVRA